MLTREQKFVLRFLRREAAAWEAEHAGEGFAYAGPAGFVLEHGEWFEPRPLPACYPNGAPRMCFGNSIVLAASHGLEYVEGYALDPGKAHAVFHHAWNVDAEGGLVDATWCRLVAVVAGAVPPTVVRGMAGAAYFGVRFAVERADDCTWNGDASVLDDSNRGWPLLRRRWEGEPETRPEYEGTGGRLAVMRIAGAAAAARAAN